MMLSILATSVALSFGSTSILGSEAGIDASTHLQQPMPGNDKVRVRMLASTSRIEPGTPFELGIELRMEPHWHVYWLNPGESGVPTFVDFVIPDGFEIDPIRFPTPDDYAMPGDVVNYGYEDTVMLLATVHPPETFSDATDSAATFSAEVEWLVCQDVCLPGRTSVEAKVSYARDVQQGRPMYRRQFEAAKNALPRSLDPSRASEHRVTPRWASVDTDQPTLKVMVADADEVEFYPLNSDNGFVCDSWSLDRSADHEDSAADADGPGTWVLDVTFDRGMPGDNSPSAPKPSDSIGVVKITRGDETAAYWIPTPDAAAPTP